MHSSNHDLRRQKRIDRQINKAREQADKAIKEARRERFACRKDAVAARDQLEKDFAKELWNICGEVESRKIYASGRVAAGKERKVRREEWRLALEVKPNKKLTEHRRRIAGCFVLLTNAPNPEGRSKQTAGKTERIVEVAEHRSWSALECLIAYKDQHGVENSFSFLKEPLIANDVFLKNPERIDALGLILLLSLLVWNLMQRCLRKSVLCKNGRLTDLDGKPTQRPTAFILAHKFRGVQILKVHNRRWLAGNLNYDQRQYLRAVGLDQTIFTEPPKIPLPPTGNQY